MVEEQPNLAAGACHVCIECLGDIQGRICAWQKLTGDERDRPSGSGVARLLNLKPDIIGKAEEAAAGYEPSDDALVRHDREAFTGLRHVIG